ncbi:hypothetical protein GPECTOR_35g872 [Gonium pectorale]|uniref:PSP proline-rich domain-containing protein n=1 Tax=Gonium pectorale TaxID=33097 RepID=A0A150GC73_GONPE|nr:hypothetical protein GPECTOR_35g872 [Gonium pectorale]|eukprot:KXZ47434.1 hypothetical protein GPECTOR_35g872 [Gonium pectorale]
MAQEESQPGPANGVAPAEPAANGAANGAKKSKAEKEKERRQKKKLNKKLRRQQGDQGASSSAAPASEDAEDDDIVIEYVSAPLDLESLRGEDGEAAAAATAAEPEEDPDRPGLGLGFGGLGFTPAASESKPAPSVDPYEEFKKVFERFASAEEVTGAVEVKDEDEDDTRAKEDKKATTSDQEGGSDDEGTGVEAKLSKKKLKLLNRLKVAELKAVCARPEVVEVWDVTGPDPPLLVFLKAYRNTVPVPRHWSQKRKYLQGKRGLEKPPFKLPDFIEATGIAEMRSAYQAKEDAKKMKQKQRERMAPKMGRMDIDYQVLHDAFFKHQKPPPLTGVGELYYEGKEFEARVTHCRPGELSETLATALGMGPNSPPPWLINMQRYGPPPSYPNLKIPGLNAPIPPSCTFGYHPGGWGKPPVDQDGNPLYGDVFNEHGGDQESDDEVDKVSLWGAMEELEVESSEEEEEEEEEQAEEGAQPPLDEEAMSEGIASGLASGMVSGLASGIASSLPSGIETPDTFNLRKEPEGPRQLYTVLEQKQVAVGATGIMGTDHVYVIPGADKQAAGGAAAKKKPDFLKHLSADVEVTISPEELEGLDEAGVKALYDAKVAELRSAHRREDFSDMVAAKAAAQKRKQQAQQDGKTAKKSKGGDTFKF